jgi:hypothetical protein
MLFIFDMMISQYSKVLEKRLLWKYFVNQSLIRTYLAFILV